MYSGFLNHRCFAITWYLNGGNGKPATITPPIVLLCLIYALMNSKENICDNDASKIHALIIEPHHVKTCLRGFFDQVRYKPACSATEASWSLEISNITTKGVVRSRHQTTRCWSDCADAHIFAWPSPVVKCKCIRKPNVSQKGVRLYQTDLAWISCKPNKITPRQIRTHSYIDDIWIWSSSMRKRSPVLATWNTYYEPSIDKFSHQILDPVTCYV